MATPVRPLVEETHFFPIMTRLIECVKAELEAAGGPTPCFLGITPGGRPPLGAMKCDDGKACGVVWLSPVSVFSSTEFPTPDEGNLSRTAPKAMELEVGVARCYPVAKGRDERADEQEYFNATRLYLSDMKALERAILCCARQNPGEPPTPLVALGEWVTLEPEARASGGQWQFWVS